ncbi:F-box/RNI-like superfamily protein [Actinidia rufa]|uniref:F-box/RNI-like superfamily protein n=1 Tax=Actinidia rufa TaxID=165716 RepID=A0A7J0FF84_9ERIC|nr:F-box/RNI-like superfamily protein [Actinidia rufa]
MVSVGMITEWKDIPMELLLRIVSLVDDRMAIIASGVCSGWRDAICWGLTQLSLTWCKNNMNNLVLSLAPKFTNLQALILRQDKPQLQDSAIEAIANYCHDLQDLDLSNSFKLSDCALFVLAHGCPNLTKLNVSGCSAFSDTALVYLAKFCRKLKYLNLCGCAKAASDKALKAIGKNCNQLQSLNLGWCEKVGDVGVMSLAYGCPDLRALDLCGCVLITVKIIIDFLLSFAVLPQMTASLLWQTTAFIFDPSASTTAKTITDRAMYSLVYSRVKNKHEMWKSVKKNRYEEEGLMNLNISQCTALTPLAVQAVCDSFPALHTCAGRHSLIISGCLSLTSVHCACAVQAHRAANSLLHPAL